MNMNMNDIKNVLGSPKTPHYHQKGKSFGIPWKCYNKTYFPEFKYNHISELHDNTPGPIYDNTQKEFGKTGLKFSLYPKYNDLKSVLLSVGGSAFTPSSCHYSPSHKLQVN